MSVAGKWNTGGRGAVVLHESCFSMDNIIRVRGLLRIRTRFLSMYVYVYIILGFNNKMADREEPPVTVEELAGKAGLPLQYLDGEFRKDYVPILAEFCDPWENIGYHLKLTRTNIETIKHDNTTSEMKRIAMLTKWKEKFAYKSTYRILIEALIQSEHAQQAQDVCQKLKSVMPNDASLFSREQETAGSIGQPSEEYIPGTDVAQSIKRLEIQFIHIQNRFLKSGPGTGVSLEQLQTCICTLPSFTADNPRLLLEANSVNMFVFHLKNYCSAIDPDILEGLIEVLGDAESKSMMQEYTKDLDNFRCKTKLKDFIGKYNGPKPPEFKEVQLKLGDNWREKTLADLKLINSQISRQSMLIKMASPGSVYVTFMIPKDDLELGFHLRDYLRTQCVLQIIVCGVCIFDCEGSPCMTYYSLRGSTV